MRNKKNLGRNYTLNLIYQVFTLIVPLITTPYVSRVLGANGVGQYSFSLSLTNYFLIFASLGFATYGQREIAKEQNDKAKQTLVFWEIFFARLISTTAALIINAILVLTGVYSDYTLLMAIWSIQIFSVALDLSFFFQGNEDFGKIVFRNIAIKLISVILIFLLVKTEKDVWLYVLCYAVGNVVGGLSLFPSLNKYLAKVSAKDLKVGRHFVPTLRLFLPTVATSVYTVLDKTFIGILVQGTYSVIDSAGNETVKRIADLENGYYEQADKIIKLALSIILALGTIMMPRNSNLYREGRIDEVRKNINFSFDYVWFLGFPMMMGLIALAPNFVPWFLGDGYEKSVLLMQIFSPLFVIVGISNVIGVQYLIPCGKDGKYTAAICSGAVCNLALNIPLIYFYWSVGAIIASLSAEVAISAIMIFMVRRELSLKTIFSSAIKPALGSIILFLAVFFTANLLPPAPWASIALILEGIIVYLISLAALRYRLLFDGAKKLKSRLQKKQGGN